MLCRLGDDKVSDPETLLGEGCLKPLRKFRAWVGGLSSDRISVGESQGKQSSPLVELIQVVGLPSFPPLSPVLPGDKKAGTFLLVDWFLAIKCLEGSLPQAWKAASPGNGPGR